MLPPACLEGRDHSLDHLIVMVGARGEAQALGAPGYGRIVDRLDIDAVFPQQAITDRLACGGIADPDRHDMAVIEHDRQAGLDQALTEMACTLLVAPTEIPSLAQD